uniref:Uncharacterized protein n=1 Tax=Alexandrium andersonii TaxID=327968 RepID=A0A7S2G9U2_9DINO
MAIRVLGVFARPCLFALFASVPPSAHGARAPLERHAADTMAVSEVQTNSSEALAANLSADLEAQVQTNSSEALAANLSADLEVQANSSMELNGFPKCKQELEKIQKEKRVDASHPMVNGGFECQGSCRYSCKNLLLHPALPVFHRLARNIGEPILSEAVDGQRGEGCWLWFLKTSDREICRLTIKDRLFVNRKLSDFDG